jgi:CRISPR/Cas system-associated exonuclease Cas4 (RecB family)
MLVIGFNSVHKRYVLEEQLNVSIETGHIFYGQKKRRMEVAINASLREATVTKIKRLRQIIVFAETPPAMRLPKCDNCSLVELCLPVQTDFAVELSPGTINSTRPS